MEQNISENCRLPNNINYQFKMHSERLKKEKKRVCRFINSGQHGSLTASESHAVATGFPADGEESKTRVGV